MVDSGISEAELSTMLPENHLKVALSVLNNPNSPDGSPRYTQSVPKPAQKTPNSSPNNTFMPSFTNLITPLELEGLAADAQLNKHQRNQFGLDAAKVK